jgi:acyl-CoA hydrolase
MASPAMTADEAVSCVRSGMRVFLHGGAATPTPLIEALARRTDLEGVRVYHMHTMGPLAIADPALAGRFTSVSLFTGEPARRAVQEGRADFVPVFLSDIPGLFLSGRIPLDVAIVQLSPPDAHGLCSLGTSCDTARAALDSARVVVAEVNAQFPRTHGHTAVPLSRLGARVETNRPIHTHEPSPTSEIEARIGELVAQLVEDGSTLQMGIGAIPDAVLARLGNKHDLGIHTEMFSDGVVPLVEGGVITNRHKSVHPGRTVTSFVVGSPRLYDFVNDNPQVEFHPCDRTNDTSLIRKNDKVVAINSALSIDLSGQVNADSVGHAIYSGIGGQMDFVRGAALSRGGKPVIALPSVYGQGSTRGPRSRIVMELAPGAGVVTTRGHVHWVVTEHGAVNLHGMTLRERGEALISIAHPDFRAELRGELARLRHYPMG